MSHSPLKNLDPEVKKFIAKLQAKATKLEFENSDLRIDKGRLQRRVKSLETALAKCDNSKPDADDLSRKAEEYLHKLRGK